MSNRTTPRKHTGTGAAKATAWKPPQQRREVVRAVLVAGLVIVLTVLTIFILDPDDKSTPKPVTPSGGATSTATAPSGVTTPLAVTTAPVPRVLDPTGTVTVGTAPSSAPVAP